MCAMLSTLSPTAAGAATNLNGLLAQLDESYLVHHHRAHNGCDVTLNPTAATKLNGLTVSDWLSQVKVTSPNISRPTGTG